MILKRKNKFIAFIIIALMALSIWPSNVFATDSLSGSNIKGKEEIVTFYIGQEYYKKGSIIVETDVAPYIKDDRTMLPIAFIASALGTDEVIWVPESQTVKIIKGDDLIETKIGSKKLIVNEKILMMDTAAEIKDIEGGGGRTMLPIAFIARALNVGYRWDGETRSVDFYGYTEIFGEKGTYGPKTDSETIVGNVVITAGKVNLRNLVIKGNLIIAEAVGDEDVYLKNIVVEGNTYIRGGGNDSIHIDGGSFNGDIIIENTSQGGIRVVANDVDGVSIIIATDVDDEVILKGTFGNVEILAANAVVSIHSQTTIENMIVNDTAEITLAATTIVKKTTFNAQTTVKAYGRMKAIYVNSNNVKIYTNTPPEIHEVSPGKKPANIIEFSRKTRRRSKEIEATGITVSPTSMILVAGGDTGTITASVSPKNASNKNVTWSSSDPMIATVDNGTVTPVRTGSAIITAALTSNRTYSAICAVTVIPPSTIPDRMNLTLIGEGITADPGAGVLQKNTEVTITVTAPIGMRVATFIVNGVNKKADLEANPSGKYIFNITEDTTVEVTYEATPSVPTNLVLWLDATDYSESTGIWPDKSGKGNSVTQDSSSSRPDYIANGLNGNPVVQFDGSDDYLNLDWADGSLDTDSLTMFLVLKNNDMSGGSQTIMGNYDQEDEVAIHKSGSSPYPITAGISTPFRDNRIAFTSDPGPYVLTYEYDNDSTAHTTFVDGIQANTLNKSADISWNDTAIGRNGGPTGSHISEWNWNGDIAEIRIYNDALTATERQAVEQELNDKWLVGEKYTVTFTNPANGSLSAVVDGVAISNGAKVAEGNDVAFTVIPDTGYQVKQWTVNGSVVPGKTGLTYIYEDLSGDVTVEVTLEATPSVPTNLVLWLDATDYSESTGIWPDKSGKGNSVTQDSSSSRPDYIANGLNGNPVVQFDGSDDYLNLDWADGSLDTDSLTMFLVLKNNDMSGGSQTIMGNYDQEDEVAIHKSGSSPYPITAGISTPFRDNRIAFTSDPGPYVLTYEYDNDSTAHTTFVDGIQANTLNKSADISWNDTAIGRNGGPTGSHISEWNWNGDIAEIRIYNDALTATERQAVEQELNDKWLVGEPGDYSILYNPYADVEWDTVNHYKANLHTHTDESDGSLSPDEVIDAYHDAGYKILALTDHDTMGGADTTWPWTDWNRDPEDLGMLAVQGNEISGTDHINSFFNDYGGASYGQEEQVLQQIQSRNGMAMINHPGRYFRSDTWYKELYETYYQQPLIGMEVHNQGDRYPSDRDLWDRINALVMPEVMIFGLSNDDMHQSSHLFRNYQFMLMDELTEEKLRDSLIEGSYYFCYESGGSGDVNPPVPRINGIEITDNGTVITIEASNININNSGHTITWKTNNGVVGTGYSFDIDDLSSGSIFLRAELVNGSGKTYTQPFVLKDERR